MNALFKIAGVLHALGSLLMVCVFVVMVIAAVSGGFADSQLSEYGENFDFPIWYAIVGALIAGLLIVLYAVSAWGFFKMKKWQPIVFTVILVLSFADFVFGIVANGFAVTSLVSLFFLGLWTVLLILVWMNKSLFKN